MTLFRFSFFTRCQLVSALKLIIIVVAFDEYFVFFKQVGAELRQERAEVDAGEYRDSYLQQAEANLDCVREQASEKESE